MAGREGLDNLVFVINCNLQRLDGPVRGNGKIIQELEAEFRGAGWNVIKVIWGTHWDALFARDKATSAVQRMMEIVDGEYQTFKAKNGRLRARAFLQHAGTEGTGGRRTDEIWNLNRAATILRRSSGPRPTATEHKGQPTLILAKTIRGFGMGDAGEGDEHQPPAEEDGHRGHPSRSATASPAGARRQALRLPWPGLFAEVRRKGLPASTHGPGRLPAAAPAQGRRWRSRLDAFAALLKASGSGRELSTTMAVVRIA